MEGVPDRRAPFALHGVGGGGGLGRPNRRLDSRTRASRGASFDRRRNVRRVGLAIAFEKTTLEGGIGGSLAATLGSKGSIVPTRKRMGCREARRASDSRPTTVGREWRIAERRFFLRIVNRSLDCISSLWVPVSTVSVADADRMHLRPCGPDRESGPGGVTMLKRGVEPEREGRDVRGRITRRRSHVSTHAERRDERSRDEGCSGSRRSRCHNRSRGLTMDGPAPFMRAIRWKASRCGSRRL